MPHLARYSTVTVARQAKCNPRTPKNVIHGVTAKHTTVILHSQNFRIRLFSFWCPVDPIVDTFDYLQYLYSTATTANTAPHRIPTGPYIPGPIQRKDVPNAALILLGQSSPQAPRSASATGGPRTQQKYIYEKPAHRLALCAVTLLLLLHIHSNSIMLVQFPTVFSPKPSQTSESIVDATSTTRTRSSTVIIMLEEELGMCEPPKSGE